MTKEGSANLTLVPFIISFVLALTATIVGYVQDGEVKISYIAPGVSLLAMGFAVRSKIIARK